MTYKRIIIAAIILTLAVSMFSACGDKTPETVSEVSEVSEVLDVSKEEGKSPLTYSYSEAAELNNEISGGQVQLVQMDEPAADTPLAIIKTTMGEIKVVLYPDEAPKAVENFISLAEDGYYTGLVFNKAVKNFIIEGGDPDGSGGESIFKNASGSAEAFENEYSLNLWHFRGALAMSNNYGQDKNGSQFFIVQAPFIDDETKTAMMDIGFPEKVIEQYEKLGGTPGFDWKRTVFGMVTEESMKIVDDIARVETGDDGEPVESIVIEEIRFTTYGEDATESGSSGSEASSK